MLDDRGGYTIQIGRGCVSKAMTLKIRLEGHRNSSEGGRQMLAFHHCDV